MSNIAELQASIVIAAYNAEQTIDAAIGSALVQEGVAFEVIVIDDASTDNTLGIIQQHVGRDDRIVRIRRAKNGGCAAARNDGLAAASGRFVVILDADDRMHPMRVAHLVAEAERLGADLVADNLRIFDKSSGRMQGVAFPPAWMTSSLITPAEYVRRDQYRPEALKAFGFSQPIMRRAFLARHKIAYDPELRLAEDFLLTMRCLLEGARFHVVNEALYDYYVRPADAHKRSSDYRIQADVNRRVRDLSLSDHPETAWRLDERLSLILYSGLRHALAMGRYRDALGFAQELQPAYLASRFARAAMRRTAAGYVATGARS